MRNPLILCRSIFSGVLGVCLGSGLLFVSAASGQPQDLTVERLAVQGNQRIESAAILGKVTLKKGDPLTTQATQEQIRLIYEMGFFDDVQVQTETTAGRRGRDFRGAGKTFCDGHCL